MRRKGNYQTNGVPFVLGANQPNRVLESLFKPGEPSIEIRPLRFSNPDGDAHRQGVSKPGQKGTATAHMRTDDLF